MEWWTPTRSNPTYQPVKDQDVVEEHELSDSSSETVLQRQKQRLRRARWIIGVIPVLFILILVLGAFVYDALQTPKSSTAADHALSSTTPSSSNPLDEDNTSLSSSNDICTIRREWRSLSTHHQQAYIAAVKCLLSKPSVLNLRVPNTTAYSDFAYIHAHVGYRTHNSAPFLPWHRYLLHIYEITLATHCNYTSGLVYWDWTLDADTDLSQSPIFDPQTGFGGDGDPKGEITIGNHGRCIVDGPFAHGTITALWYDVKYQPHCLSRGFRNDAGRGTIDSSTITNSSIERVLSLTSYESFVKEIEAKVHDAIPFGIGGDFETFSAPFDPLFFLHHTQLDRLWWLWQRQDQPNRMFEYGGHNARHSLELATLSDLIDMGGLAPKVEVEKVMAADGSVLHEGKGILCYSYE